MSAYPLCPTCGAEVTYIAAQVNQHSLCSTCLTGILHNVIDKIIAGLHFTRQP